MHRVFVTQESVRKNNNGELIPMFDLTPAAEYGNIITLLPRGPGVTLNTGLVVQHLKQKLSDFCDDDYILPIGDPTAFMLAALVAGKFNNGKVKVLKWDREIHNYMMIQLEV